MTPGAARLVPGADYHRPVTRNGPAPHRPATPPNRRLLRAGPLTRRSFLAGAGALTLAACSGGGGDTTATSGTLPTNRVSGSVDENAIVASRLFDTAALALDGTPQRTLWAFNDGQGYLTDTAPATVQVTVTDQPETGADGQPVGEPNVVLETEVALHGDGLSLSYYPVEVVFASDRPHDFLFRSELGDVTGVAIAGSGAADLIHPGMAFPSLATPTMADPRGVDPVCTRVPEPCPFHDVSLDEALAAGRPVILNVSTPAFCATQIACGPVLELLIDEAGALPADTAVIHAEVYQHPTAQELLPTAPIIDAVGAWFEPFIFVIDRDGTVLRRLDFLWDRAELDEALALLA